MGSDLSRDAILQRLTTQFIGRNLLYYPIIPSTMDAARKAASGGAGEGTAVVAEEQTAGRGRLGRSWINPPGVIAISIILRPELSQLLHLTMVASLATSRCIERVTGLNTAIKWPNDILINSRKVSGILTENTLREESIDWAIIGIGINVNFNPKAFPEIADTATSLSHELGNKVSQLEIVLHLLREIELLYLASRRGDPIHVEWQNRLETLGKVVQLKSGEQLEEGYAESVDSDGSLLLRRSDGSLARFIAGEVTLHA
jgi:BirA family biotin operon repressor/biotin-[acetyl-CoA-carboxylase] ligase